MKKGRFLWSAHRITEKQKAGKARNIKGKQLKNSRNTASKLPVVRLSSASANRQLSQPKIFPSPGAARPRGFFCGRRGGRGAWPPAPLSACALWRAFAGPCRRGGTAGCTAPPCFCFCAKPCRGASLFRQAPLFLMRVSDISFPALLERVKSFRSQY